MSLIGNVHSSHAGQHPRFHCMPSQRKVYWRRHPKNPGQKWSSLSVLTRKVVVANSGHPSHAQFVAKLPQSWAYVLQKDQEREANGFRVFIVIGTIMWLGARQLYFSKFFSLAISATSLCQWWQVGSRINGMPFSEGSIWSFRPISCLLNLSDVIVPVLNAPDQRKGHGALC